ncbi:hypothetical protein [Chryseobacterium caseinilyticum]|uniref:Uncharacterized protein n=1 Tax=Chryseobacterium caseinilyticum TaxID=2771428 RepID=A0ABR8ZGG9_9FLAO|nr:hypothetical protein [Chryseobacterium caseinilyticum]MBD8084396.1 hypothetical protein [Chryseobacterium caseinilyticum]
MGFFSFLFGKKKQAEKLIPPKEDPIVATSETGEKFDREIVEAYKRYHSDPVSDISLIIEDQKGNIVPPHIAHHQIFSEWEKIQSKWDRMSVLYEFWDRSQLENLEDWKVMERFTKDRYATKSLKYFREKVEEKNQMSVEELVAASKLHRILLDNDAAMNYAQKAYEKSPNNDLVKVEYASVLHLSKDTVKKEKSHQIIGDVLDKKMTDTSLKSVFDCFIFSENYLDSSVFAMAYLINTDAGLETWDYVAEEYYYCPIFRYEHAVKLSESENGGLRALAKLTSLSQEFPWFTTAVQSTVKNIESMRLQLGKADFMEEEYVEFKKNLEK